MANYNTLNWQNENALSSHPFDLDIEVQDFVVDASFVQFDSFVPTLDYVYVSPTKITLDMTFDFGTLTDLTFLKESYDAGIAYRHIRIYQPSNTRYLGTVVFGEGANMLWKQYLGQRIRIASRFSASVVRSIPSKDAVYLLDSSYGDVTFTRTSADRALFYNVSESMNSITFNAVGGHSASDAISDNSGNGLKKINLVKPLNNNINLASNDVVKVTPFNASSLKIALVTGSKSPTFVLPTLIA
jgi:hypothetical protein